MEIKTELPEELKLKFIQKLIVDTREGKLKWEKDYSRSPEANFYSNKYSTKIGKHILILIVTGSVEDNEMVIGNKLLWFERSEYAEASGDDLDELITAIDPTGTVIRPTKTQIHQDVETYVMGAATYNPVVGEEESRKGFWSKIKSIF
jgi:hypothetical protein